MDWLQHPNPYAGMAGSSADIPDTVEFEDLPDPSGTLVHLGVSHRGVVTFDLDSESPHVLVNAPTGMGKSAVARSLAVQRLMVGDVVIVLDRKMHSHNWARGLEPVVHYADQVGTIGSALVNLGRELHARNQRVRDGEEPGPRIVALFEETNATLSELKKLDKSLVKGSYGALDAVNDIMFMGRAVGIHLVAFAQLASYRSGLTADLLENFGTRVMVGYSSRAWKWLADDCGSYRVAPSETGRGMVCRAGKAVETQLVWLPESDARSLVLDALPAQRRVRELSGGRARVPEVWRNSIGR